MGTLAPVTKESGVKNNISSTFPKKIKKLTPFKSLSPGNPVNTTFFI